MINFPGHNRKLENETKIDLVNSAINTLQTSKNYYLKGKEKEEYLMDDIDNACEVLSIVLKKLEEGK